MSTFGTSVYPCFWFISGPCLPEHPVSLVVSAILALYSGFREGLQITLYHCHLLILGSFLHSAFLVVIDLAFEAALSAFKITFARKHE